MSERRGTKALETWCRRLTEGYPGVKVENMTTSWRDGLAFCAIIHHFRPELIDFASLTPANIYYNNSLAFNVAERQLGIPALLDAEDMVMYSVPDRLSILTYLSQFYQVFGNQSGVSAGGKQGSSRIVPKRSAISTISADRGIISSASSSPPTKMASRSSVGVTGGVNRREPCAKCGFPVFLAERLNVGTKLYHRTCFRCARCNNQLSLANCYETETDEYCCETCPDEEDQPNNKITKFDSLDNVKSIEEGNNHEKVMETIKKFESSESLSQATDSKKLDRLDQVRNRSLSDEEKSKGLQQFEDEHDDEYSADFEHALEDTSNDKIYQDDSLLSKARSSFLTSHLQNEEDAVVPKIIIDTPPPLPKSEPPDISSSSTSLTTEENIISLGQQVPDSESSASNFVNNITTHESDDSNVNKADLEISTAQQNTASDEMLEDTTNLRENNITKDANRSSLVKSRMLLFELANKDSNSSLVTTNKDKVNSIAKYLNNKVPLDKQDISESISVPDSTTNTPQEEIEAKTELPTEINNSVSSEKDNSNISNEANFQTVKSDMNVSDSLDLYSSVLSDNFPLNESSNDLLSKSIIDNLSGDQSAVIITDSILEDSSSPKNEDEIYPDDLNPFGDDPEENDQQLKNLKQVIKPSMEDLTIITPPKKEEKRHSTNPFGSSDEDEDTEAAVVKQKPPRPPQPTARSSEAAKKILEAPKVNLNPFWSDDEEPSEEEINAKPTPMPRTKHLSTPEPKPRRSGLSNNSYQYDSNSSLSSMNSSIGHTPGRKKKPAPPPPKGGASPEGSKQSSPSTSTQPSPKLTPRVRKNRKAPLPPTSTPFLSSPFVEDNINVSPIINISSDVTETKSDVEESVLSPTGSDIEKEKIDKDEKNRNRQSQTIASPVLSDSDSLSLSQQGSSSTDKSTHGKWKRKKGPAPARPVPQRRQIRPLPLIELRRELDIIEMQQQGLEKQGVKLEQLIREKCEVPGTTDDTALSPEVEDLVLELFELVNEKNELFRRQAELMYLRRQQRLEEEHADLEYQIRCLMDRPERNKTDSDKTREEELINRLLEVVERRNEIVECLEMDRVREAEEDQSINFHLSQLASKKEEEQLDSPIKLSKKEKKKMKKEKKLKEKGKTLDADKDIDESETSSVNIVKEKKKKKWF